MFLKTAACIATVAGLQASTGLAQEVVFVDTSDMRVIGCTADRQSCKIESGGVVGWVEGRLVPTTDNVVVLDRNEEAVLMEVPGPSDEEAAGLVALGAVAAIFGGPVGMAAAGSTLALVGGASASGSKVTRVSREALPPVVVAGDVVVGSVLPDGVILTPTSNSDYASARIDGVLVVVDADRKVIWRQ